MWWLLACSRVPAPDLPKGSWALTAQDARGVVEVGRDCTIHVSGPGWGTVGPVRCEAHENAGWFVFPLQTGAGKAMAVARWEEDRVVLPLGSREGEFDVVFERAEGTLEVPRADLTSERAMWDAARFRLHDGDQLVGALSLGEPPMIEVYDAWWLTNGPVPAVPGERGPDLLLEFDVEPTLAGERALLLLNRPLREAVVPSGNEPADIDRRFTLVPGMVTVEERQAAVDAAVAEADAIEAERMGSVLNGVVGTLAPPCPSELPADYASLFVGYAVSVTAHEDRCRVAVEPAPTQHRRRFRGLSD
ncbi:MAG: hypothetical protein GY913_33035 [Proteobacteria bacterium]|nr:hypothetical protein [Pseudomonadota bacterium]MCP4921750.1 hypothetical protein [Pseudomonadota bacterium]